MLTTKIKTTTYAAKLRARLAKLTKERPNRLKQYEAALAHWREELAAWLKKDGVQRTTTVKVQKERSGYVSELVMFNTVAFFDGAPVPPEYPSDKAIREIRALLRHLGITGQAYVTVSTADVSRYLGDEAERGDDE